LLLSVLDSQCVIWRFNQAAIFVKRSF
jgi:hypothetical protein